MSVLKVDNLSMHFPILGGLFRKVVGHVYAVNDVSFEVTKGETLGIVGESGCGKTTLGRAVVRLYQPTGGTIDFDGADISGLKGAKLYPYKRRIQMIFQDPYASLNPRMNVNQMLMEPLRLHSVGKNRAERQQMVLDILKVVGLRPDDRYRFPHEFSGGQRQRIGIARALILKPDLIVADEPVSALDVSIQSQVLNLLNELQDKMGLTYLFISHDLTVVKYIADKIMVMYLGNAIEHASSESIYRNPRHPYTRSLLSAVPVPNPERENTRFVLKGDVPSPSSPPPGCAFNTRCPFVTDLCRTKKPAPQAVEGDPGHWVACHNSHLTADKPLAYRD